MCIRDRIDGLAVQLSLQYDLAFRDISGQVGDGMSDVIIWHGQNRELGYGAVYALYDAGALVDGGKFAVEVSGEP